MADGSLSDKFWKLASYSYNDLLGFGDETSTTPNNQNKNAKKECTNDQEKTSWPSCVKSKSKHKWGEYDEPDATKFDVRGKNYLNDKIKIKSEPSLFKLADFQIYECNVSSSYHIAKNNKSWYKQHHKKLAKDTFYLIYNMQLSSINTSLCATFVIKTNQPPSASTLTSPSATTTDTDNSPSKPPKSVLMNDQQLIDDMLDEIDSLSSDSTDDERDDNTNNNEKEKNTETDDDKKTTQKIEENDEEVVVMNGNKKKENKKNDDDDEEEKKEETKAKITFTLEDIESMPNIEQKIIHNDVVPDITDLDKLWCPKLGYKPYDEYIWKKFMSADELFINSRLKIIPQIVEGSWYFTFPQRPALLGMKVPQRCYRGHNYLEIDCEADNSLIASQITKAAYHISTYLVVDIMLTIEGQKNDQLPERCIGGFQIRYADTTKATKLFSDHETDQQHMDQSNTPKNKLDNNDK